MINRLLSLSIKTKITITIFIFIFSFSLTTVYLIKQSLANNMRSSAINITKDLIKVNETFIIKSILEDDYWSIYKVLRSLNQLDIIDSVGFVGKDGKIIAHTDTKDYPIYKTFKFDSFQGTVIPLIRDNKRLGTFVILVNNSAVKYLFNNLNRQVLISIVLLGLISFFIAFLISKRILKRLNFLSYNAKQIQQGNFDKIIKTKSLEKDEISNFQESIEIILTQLNQSLTNEQNLKIFYHSILKGIDGLIVIADENLHVEYQNDHKFKRIVLKDKRFNDEILTKIKECNEKKECQFSFQTYTLQSEVLYLYMTINKIENNYVVIFQNITKLKLLEEKQQLTNSFELIGEISSSVIHEIKNYLQPIKLLVEQESLDAEDQDRIVNIVARISSLVNRFLSSWKPIDKKLSENIDIEAAIESYLFLLSIEFKTKNIVLEKNYEKDLYTNMSDNDFELVMINLIKNALEASPPHSKITLESFSTHQHSVIRISNRGKPIDKTILENISKPFFTTKETGHGLGLYTIYKIVYLYGGFIEVSSNKESTIFTINLPKKELF